VTPVANSRHAREQSPIFAASKSAYVMNGRDHLSRPIGEAPCARKSTFDKGWFDVTRTPIPQLPERCNRA
jgi:hypothetical protein